MTVFTTYLSHLKSIPKHIERIYVMRNRGNPEIEPPADLLEEYKAGRMSFAEYIRRYRESLETKEAYLWMKRIARLSREKDLVLVCYEAKASHCHRSILLDRIRQLFPQASIGGELK